MSNALTSVDVGPWSLPPRNGAMHDRDMDDAHRFRDEPDQDRPDAPADEARGGRRVEPMRLTPLLPRRQNPWLLVDVDGSPAAHGALVWSLREAARREATVVAVWVVDDEEEALPGLPRPGRRTDAVAQERLEAQVLRAIPETLPRAAPPPPRGAVGSPPAPPPMHSFLGVPVRVGGAVFGHLFLTVERVDAFTDADLAAAVGLAAAASLAIGNAELVERAEHRRAWAQAGTDIATALLSGADPDTVLRSIGEQVAGLASADAAGVLVPTPDDEDVLTVVVAVGAHYSEYAEGVRLPLADTQLVMAHRTGTPVLIPDVSTAAVGGRRAPVLGEMTERFGPTLVIPLGGRPALGTVVAMRRRGREPFPPDTLELASAFAAQASVALELARSQQRERRPQGQADRGRSAPGLRG